MARKVYTPEQIINKLREAEILISQGATSVEASRKIGVTDRIRFSKYCGMTEPGFSKLHDEREELEKWRQIGKRASFQNQI